MIIMVNVGKYASPMDPLGNVFMQRYYWVDVYPQPPGTHGSLDQKH